MSPSIMNLAPNAVGQGHSPILAGTVSTLQPAPNSFNSPLFVVIDGWSPDYFQVVSGWPACNGAALPQPGAAVMLIRDDQDFLRCVWWAGAHSPSVSAPFCNKLTNHLLAH